jgi:hypothetical protein
MAARTDGQATGRAPLKYPMSLLGANRQFFLVVSGGQSGLS